MATDLTLDRAVDALRGLYGLLQLVTHKVDGGEWASNHRAVEARDVMALAEQHGTASETRDTIIEEIAGHTKVRSFANGEFNWCITDYEIRALKSNTPQAAGMDVRTPDRERPDQPRGEPAGVSTRSAVAPPNKLVTCPGCKQQVRPDAPACEDRPPRYGAACPLWAKGAGAALAAAEKPGLEQQIAWVQSMHDDHVSGVRERGDVEGPGTWMIAAILQSLKSLRSSARPPDVGIVNEETGYGVATGANACGPSAARAPEEIEQMQADLGETMQILGKALTGDDGIHIGHVPDMARDLVAKLKAPLPADRHTARLLDAIVAMVEQNGAKMVNLPGWDELSLAFHDHPASHVDKDKLPRSATEEKK